MMRASGAVTSQNPQDASNTLRQRHQHARIHPGIDLHKRRTEVTTGFRITWQSSPEPGHSTIDVTDFILQYHPRVSHTSAVTPQRKRKRKRKRCQIKSHRRQRSVCRSSPPRRTIVLRWQCDRSQTPPTQSCLARPECARVPPHVLCPSLDRQW